MVETPNLLAPEVRANPYPLYAQLRRERPVCQVEPGGFWAVSRYEDVVAVLRNHQAFSSEGFRALFLPSWIQRNPIAFSLLVRDPPAHTRLRALVSRPFEPRSVGRLEGRVRAIAGELASSLGGRGEVDFVGEFASPLPGRIIAEILGLDPSLHVHFKRWSDDTSMISPGTDPALHDRIRASVAEMEGYLRDVIAARRRHPEDDMVSALLSPGSDGQVLSDEEALSFLALLLPAGFETTTHLLAHALSTLATRPDDLARLRANPSLIPGFVDEVLRHEPPVHGVFRLCVADTKVANTTIPAGSVVIALLGSANRDESRFPDPDRFDMRRGAGKDLAFGHGVHACVGAALARLEAHLALEALVARYHRITAAPGPLVWNVTPTVRGPVALPLSFESDPTALAA